MTNEDMTSDMAAEGLDLRRYFFLLLRWLWLIILVAALAGGAAYYFNSRITPVYQASTLLLVSSPAQTVVGSSSVVTSYFVADTYAQMLTNQPVLEQIISELNIPLSPGALKGMIKVAVISNTQMLRVTVEDTNPQRAADIANKLGIVFVQPHPGFAGRTVCHFEGRPIKTNSVHGRADQPDSTRNCKQPKTGRPPRVGSPPRFPNPLKYPSLPRSPSLRGIHLRDPRKPWSPPRP